MQIKLTKIEENILKELKLLNKENKFVIHECYKGYPAEFTSKLVNGITETKKVKAEYARMEYCIDIKFNEIEIRLVIKSSDDLQSFKNLLSNKNNFLKNCLGCYNEEYVDLLIYKINSEKLFFSNHVNKLELDLFFQQKKLTIELSQNPKDNLLADFIKIYNGPKNLTNNKTILRIKGLELNSSKISEDDLKSLLSSVFFDIKCLRNEYFEVYDYHFLSENYKIRKSIYKQEASDKHRLVFKKLIPELIEYFKVADQINYSPFKFLCYYHILEYFLDKSAHLAIKRKIDSVLYQSDFDANSDSYIDEILQSFKDEGDRLKSDKIKIQRVLQEFLNKETILEFINNINLNNHFFKDQIFEFKNKVILAQIKTDNESQFFKSLSDRIYSIRCSVVHSNPDFGIKKGVPFVSSKKNLSILEKEIYLLEEIGKTLIIGSKIPLSNNGYSQ